MQIKTFRFHITYLTFEVLKQCRTFYTAVEVLVHFIAADVIDDSFFPFPQRLDTYIIILCKLSLILSSLLPCTTSNIVSKQYYCVGRLIIIIILLTRFHIRNRHDITPRRKVRL